MWSSIIMQENNFVMPGVGAFFLECSTQSHQLCSIESPSNDLVRFEQLIIHNTKLIPPNTQHEFFSMNIRLDCRCWSIARWSPWFPLLWVIVVDSFFISDYTMQKNPFVYIWQAAFHMWKVGVQHFSASVHMDSLAFESFPMISNDMKLFVKSLLM